MTRRPKPRRGTVEPTPEVVERVRRIFSRRGGPGRGQGAKPRAGVASGEVIRARCSESEKAEILDACSERGRDLSDVTRELLLAWARGEQG